MTKQPEALRLADLLESDGWPDASTELRRLHEIIGTYLEKDKEQEPVEWVDLLKDAQQIVESKFLWKRFIDGTPLANDIACWMADFAEQHTTPPQRKPLTDEQIAEIAATPAAIPGSYVHSFARAIEAAHGIKEKNNVVL